MTAVRTFWRGIEWAIAALMAAMMILVFVNVVLRYGFASGLRPGIELSRLGFVWIVMLGASLCLKEGEHLAVGELFDRLPRPVRLVLGRLLWLVILIAALMLLVGCWRQTLANWHNISPLTGLPSGLFYLAGVVSGALMSVTATLGLLRPGYSEAPGVGAAGIGASGVEAPGVDSAHDRETRP
ncbi:MAG: TRAP transporter small permease [Salinicola sp.]|uniref:TRAP transporter small permease n=1 Tax=Salinicola sp. TaxID=1978524 RepID=UPI001D92FDF2|nr:TRAP transporter small permease [Salinicola sp.]NRB56581.1 TRAP transporter small permease [Salinicola sp.]